MRKSWLIGLLVLGTLSGCGLKVPGASGESAVRTSKTRYAPVVKVTPKPVSDAPLKGEAAAKSVVQTETTDSEGTAATPEASEVPTITLAPLPEAEAPKPAATPTPAPSPTPTPVVSVIQTPKGTYRAVPVLTPEGDVLDMHFMPASAEAVWQMQTLEGELLVSKVKLAMRPDGDGETLQLEVAPADLGWPTVLKGAQTLTLPLNVEALDYLVMTNPGLTGYAVEVSFLDAAGQVISDADAQPLILKLAVDVL